LWRWWIKANHNAAERQTGSVGDLEITLIGDEQVITGYDMKMRRVTRTDMDLALQKIIGLGVQNYIFITTDIVEPDVREYAASLYEKTEGIEVVVLDCIGFLRHFLHLFHRRRTAFVEAYQQLIWSSLKAQSDSPLKKPGSLYDTPQKRTPI
jgi:hypothetical protein